MLVSLLLAACTSTGAPDLTLSSPSFADPGGSGVALADSAGGGGIVAEGDAEGDVLLPDEVAYMPMAKPGAAVAAAAAVEEASSAARAEAAADAEAPDASEPDTKPAAVAAAKGQVLENGGQYLTAGVMPDAPPIEPKKKSFLSAFFGASPAAAAPAPSPIKEKPKPIVTIDKEKAAEKPLRMASLGSQDEGGEFALPGVRQTALFEIKRKSGLDDDSDVDLHEDEAGPEVMVASAAGLARLAPNGLLKQRDSVDVACLKPSLVRMLKQVERHYGKQMVVTSGYRSPAHNRRVNGAKKSMHMYCAAVDVQIPGVSKWDLAQYVRSMPGRGGVGTYCHTNSVHIDVGPERDWNWRCRRRKA